MIRTLLVTAGLVAAFLIPAYFVEREVFREWLAYGLLVACFIGLVRWVPAAWTVYRKRASERPSLGILGVVVLLSSIAVWQIYTLYNLRAGEPVWHKATDIFNAIVYCLLLGAALFVFASKFDGEQPSRVGKTVAGSMAVLGLFFHSFGQVVLSKLGAIIQALGHVFP